MICAWKELLGVLPLGFRQDVDTLGREGLQEVRLRLGQSPVLVLGTGRKKLPGSVTEDHLQFVINAASRYSPWSSLSVSEGYLTAPGGHRIGICGDVVMKHGCVTGFGTVRSLNIRVARDFPGLSKSLDPLRGNVLILGPPGSGKTTLLRDLIRRRSALETVSVVDSRGELFPAGFDTGEETDVLTGCPKGSGIDMLLRTMTPQTMALDEITAPSDSQALLLAAGCGVKLLATAHAKNQQDLKRRSVYRPIVENGLFDWVVVMAADKSFRTERMHI